MSNIILYISFLFFSVYGTAQTLKNDCQVAFFPEGGYLLSNTSCQVAFVLNQSKDWDIQIVDNNGNVIQNVNTLYKDMGYFYLYPVKGQTYYMRCSDENGITKLFELPQAVDNQYSLKVISNKEQLLITVAEPKNTKSADSLFLLIQSGDSTIYADQWKPANKYIVLSKENAKPGLSSILLLDQNKTLLSGRVLLSLKDQSSLSMLPPDFQTRLLPIMNELQTDPLKREKVLDVFAQTLIIEKDSSSQQNDITDIWKNVMLDEIFIKAFRKDKPMRGMYTATIPSSQVLTREQIENWHIQDMRTILSRFSGVDFRVDEVTRKPYVVIRHDASSFLSKGNGMPLVVIDDIPIEKFEVLDYPVTDIEEIFILKGADAAIFGPKALNGIIVITTKRGTFNK